MFEEDESIDTLVSISGTLAGIGLALVGILSAKSTLSQAETVADDLFLFASLGFLVVVALGYLVQKKGRINMRVKRMLHTAEWIFSAALLLLLVAGFILVYTEI